MLLLAHRKPGVPNGATSSDVRHSFLAWVPSSRMATSSVLTSAIGQSLVYMPLLPCHRMRSTSSIEAAYWAALRIRFDCGVESGSYGVCDTVVSPITMPAELM